jgi:hypothetical protein
VGSINILIEIIGGEVHPGTNAQYPEGIELREYPHRWKLRGTETKLQLYPNISQGTAM